MPATAIRTLPATGDTSTAPSSLARSPLVASAIDLRPCLLLRASSFSIVLVCRCRVSDRVT
eukprot:scaffold298276_cov39-Tisochrysis_lutea.AAC.3